MELAVKAEKTLQTRQLQPQFGPGYPLTVLLGAFFVGMARLFSVQDPVIAVNFMSVVFSALCILSLYFLAKKLFDETAAVLSAVMLAVSPIFLGVSVYGKNHTLSLFFLMQGISWLISFLKTGSQKYFWGAALFLGFMGAAREPDLVLVGLSVSFLLLYGYPDHRGLFKRFQTLCGFWLAVCFIVLLFHLPILGKDGNSSTGNQFLDLWKTGFQKDFLGILSPVLPISFHFLLATLTRAGLILAIIGLLNLAWKSPRIFIFLALWIAVPLLFYGNKETLSPRYLSLILPPLLLGQGYLFSRFIQKNALLRWTAYASFIMIVCLLFSRIYPVLEFRHQHALLPEFARWLGKNTEPDAKIIVGDEALFIRYYAKRETLSRPRSFHSISDEKLQQFKNEIDHLLSNDIPIYITGIGLYGYDPQQQFSNFIKKYYDLELRGRKLTEDWHRGEMFHRINFDEVYQIRKKHPAPVD